MKAIEKMKTGFDWAWRRILVLVMAPFLATAVAWNEEWGILPRRIKWGFGEWWRTWATVSAICFWPGAGYYVEQYSTGGNGSRKWFWKQPSAPWRREK